MANDRQPIVLVEVYGTAERFEIELEAHDMVVAGEKVRELRSAIKGAQPDGWVRAGHTEINLANVTAISVIAAFRKAKE